WSDIAKAIFQGKDEASREKLVKVAEQLGLDKAKMTLDEALLEKKRLQHLAGRVAVWYRHVSRSPQKAVLALFFLVLPVAVATISKLFFQDAERAVASATAALGSIVALASWIRSTATPLVDLIDDALARAEKVEEQLRLRLSDEEKRLAAERERLAAAEAKLEQQRRSLLERQGGVGAGVQIVREGRRLKGGGV